ncbi:uncharacterized protein LOC141506333 [Macrotis lagotis]|uniref:uncharacterized protein LOC141506333 n=1 Tax=Macrotis lagotis TaxID=92651 RepID=UPI003D681A0C
MAHKWLSILGILSRLKPIDSRSIPLHWKNLTEATHFTYWTVIPGFPMVVPATWIGDPVELQLAGSAYLVLGGLKGAPPEKKHDLKSPVTLTSLHLPICLTTGSHPLCAQVVNGTLKETPHGPDSNLGHGDFLHFSMIQHLMPVAYLTPVDKTKGDIHYVSSLPLPNNSFIGRMALSEFNKTWHWILGGGCNTTKPSWESNKTDGPCNFMDRIRVAAGMSPNQEIPHSPLPPCSPSPTMFEAVQVCSTGVPVYGPNVNGTQVYFLDGGPGPYFAAPVPHVMKDKSTRPQTHLWKAAAAFDVIIHSTDNTAPAKVNNTIWNLWAELFYDLYWVCPEGQRTDYWCNVFTTQAVTVLPIYLDELDKIINTIRNITDQYKKDMEDDHGLFPDWINKIDLNHWMHYLLILGAWCLMALLLCCLFPLLFSLFIKMGRWALEQLKADILMSNKKGELSGVGPDRLGG